jgi:hypothetical protein
MVFVSGEIGAFHFARRDRWRSVRRERLLVSLQHPSARYDLTKELARAVMSYFGYDGSLWGRGKLAQDR